MVKKKLRYDPRDPSRKIRSEILVKFRVRDASRSFMATHLVAKRCDLGSLGVPGRASTPLGLISLSLTQCLSVESTHRGDAAGAGAGPRIRGKSGLAGSSIHP